MDKPTQISESSELSLFIFKDRFKFSSAHMTLFPDGTKESLHGHNYQVGVRVQLAENHPMISFEKIKEVLGRICNQWDEKLLLPSGNPSCQVRTIENDIQAVICGKRYLFPADEVVLLETDNVTSENLAKLLGENLLANLSTSVLDKKISGIEVEVEETTGQGALYRWQRRPR